MASVTVKLTRHEVDKCVKRNEPTIRTFQVRQMLIVDESLRPTNATKQVIDVKERSTLNVHKNMKHLTQLIYLHSMPYNFETCHDQHKKTRVCSFYLAIFVQDKTRPRIMLHPIAKAILQQLDAVGLKCN